MKISLIVPAAGSGKRMGAEINKQYLLLKGLPVLAHTLARFDDLPEIEEIIVVAAPGEVSYCREMVVEAYGFKKVKKVVPGGATRQDSVYNGLREVSGDSDYVVIHDGARPFLKKETLRQYFEELSETEALIFAVPEKNTLKRVQNHFVVGSIPREGVWEIQTPQGFNKKLLLKAFEAAKSHLEDFTDDSSIVESQGMKVKVFQGDHLNIKVTTPEDLALGEAILEMI